MDKKMTPSLFLGAARVLIAQFHGDFKGVVAPTLGAVAIKLVHDMLSVKSADVVVAGSIENMINAPAFYQKRIKAILCARK
ncbi:hypothetical protein [Bartonella sp. DGB2]|uniref:hypothetical protein n=1 Tax=Bartonella sp. DGB2 TaxID=3388426 RepID=UPI00398FA630